MRWSHALHRGNEMHRCSRGKDARSSNLSWGEWIGTRLGGKPWVVEVASGVLYGPTLGSNLGSWHVMAHKIHEWHTAWLRTSPRFNGSTAKSISLLFKCQTLRTQESASWEVSICKMQPITAVFNGSSCVKPQMARIQPMFLRSTWHAQWYAPFRGCLQPSSAKSSNALVEWRQSCTVPAKWGDILGRFFLGGWTRLSSEETFSWWQPMIDMAPVRCIPWSTMGATMVSNL